MSRAVRSALNFAASTGTAVLSICVGFLVAPFLLGCLGEERIGAFRMATDLVGYLALLELGVAQALAPLIAQAAATGGKQLPVTLGVGARAYLRISVYTLLAGLCILAALPMLIPVNRVLEPELYIGFAIGLLAILILPLKVYQPLAEAMQKGYLVSLLLSVQLLFIQAASVAAAFANWGLIGQFAATAAGAFVLPLGLMLLFRRDYPPTTLLEQVGDMAEESRRLKSLYRLNLLWLISSRISLQSNNLIIGWILGTPAVASFIYTQRLSQAAGGQVQALGAATWAGLAELFQSGQVELFQQRIGELTKVTAVLGGAAIVPLIALTKPFVTLWLGKEQYAGDLVVGLSVLNGLFLAVFSLWGWVFSGTARVAALMPFLIIQAVASLCISLVATELFGMPGPLIGMAAVNIGVGSWILPRLLKKHFGIAPNKLLTAAVAPLVPAALVLIGQFAIRETWPNYTWTRLAIEFAISAGIYLAAAWFMVLNDAERGLFRRLFARFRRGKDEAQQ